jgi:predicted nucleic acid-binding protein
MLFIDTNTILRYLTRDDPDKAARVKSLLERAQRKEVILVTNAAVITELVFVLSSPRLYNLPRDQVRALLLPIVTIKGLKLPYRRSIQRALDLYATTPVDFVDALIIAEMERQKLTEIVSYDEDFDRVRGIRRVEP